MGTHKRCSGLVAILDMFDELLYFRLKYNVDVETLKDIVEYVVVCHIKSLMVNNTHMVYNLYDATIDSEVFYMEDIELLASELNIDLSVNVLANLLKQIDDLVCNNLLTQYWYRLNCLDVNLDDYTVKWFKCDLHIRIGR